MDTAKKIRRLLIVSISAVAAVVAAANTPTLVNWWKSEPEEPVAEAGKDDREQRALANEMTAWLQPFDTTNSTYYLNGFLTAIDRADSANALGNVPYTVCRSGDELYVRMAETEAVNDKPFYCFADHSAKRMLLGKSRSLLLQPGLPVSELYKYIRDEGYKFTKTQNNSGLWTITMENPQHISRKEFTVQYDSVNRRVSKLFIRHAEVTDPMNAGKEKWITLVINEWDDDPDPRKYIDVRKFVKKEGNEWACAPAYENYDLITQ